MNDCKDYLNKAFYHIMKMEMKRNKRLQFPGYHHVNALLQEMYIQGKAFRNSVIYVEDNVIHLSDEFFRLSAKERDAVLSFMMQFCEEVKEE